jgi:hypothetical protein
VDAATPIGNRPHRSAADAQSGSDLALRQLVFLQQPIDLLHDGQREHRDLLE